MAGRPSLSFCGRRHARHAAGDQTADRGSDRYVRPKFYDKRADVSPNTVLFWKTGVCGGFTTFSTFSLEAYKLFENKAYMLGGTYAALSVCCCFVGVFFGKKLATVIG